MKDWLGRLSPAQFLALLAAVALGPMLAWKRGDARAGPSASPAPTPGPPRSSTRTTGQTPTTARWR